MNATIQQAIERILAALQTHDERQARYDRDPAFRREDQERDRAEIAGERDRAIDAAAGEIDREAERIEKEFRRARKTDFDQVAVAEAARRFRELVAAGLGPDDVIAMPGLTREMAEAIRQNERTRQTVASKGRDAERVERDVARVMDWLDEAELPLMDPIERYATEQELGRRSAVRAIQAIARFRSAPPTDTAQIAVGLALSDAGFVPPAPAVDHWAQAERARNSLPAELRDRLEGDSVGWRSVAADPSLPGFAPDGTRAHPQA